MTRQQLSILIFSTIIAVCAQARTVVMTLDDVVSRARIKSVDAAVALNELKTAYWEWRTFRADQLPEVTFDATLPSYAKQYSAYMNENGDYSFVRSNSLQLNGQLSVSQNIRFTGGKIALNTSLDFLRQFDNGRGNRYMSLPVALTLNQPVFGVNAMKWESRIEPVRYSEAKAAFISASENVALSAVNLYFQLIMNRENLEIARQNLANTEKLYEVAKEKRSMGQISGNDLLQMELNVLNARSSLTECTSSAKSSMFSLTSFLDFESDVEIEPVIPEDIPHVKITYPDALDKALTNNSHALNIRRRQLEADYEVAKAKGDMRQLNIFAQIGYTGTDDNLKDAYSRLKPNQVVEIGVSIPLLDWGKRRGKVKVAESNRRVVESRLRKESQDFNQTLFILVERFANQQSQLDIAIRADEISRRRYDTNFKTYMIGKISTLDLNDSQSKKDESRRQYFNELYYFWYYWYLLRSITLYDYENNRDINADIARLVSQ